MSDNIFKRIQMFQYSTAFKAMIDDTIKASGLTKEEDHIELVMTLAQSMANASHEIIATIKEGGDA